MSEKWITICRDCGNIHRGKHYECACGSQQVKQRDIAPLFPEGLDKELEISPEQQRQKENEG